MVKSFKGVTLQDMTQILNLYLAKSRALRDRTFLKAVGEPKSLSQSQSADIKPFSIVLLAAIGGQVGAREAATP
jgi:hypothetical protein